MTTPRPLRPHESATARRRRPLTDGPVTVRRHPDLSGAVRSQRYDERGDERNDDVVGTVDGGTCASVWLEELADTDLKVAVLLEDALWTSGMCADGGVTTADVADTAALARVALHSHLDFWQRWSVEAAGRLVGGQLVSALTVVDDVLVDLRRWADAGAPPEQRVHVDAALRMAAAQLRASAVACGREVLRSRDRRCSTACSTTLLPCGSLPVRRGCLRPIGRSRTATSRR